MDGLDPSGADQLSGRGGHVLMIQHLGQERRLGPEPPGVPGDIRGGSVTGHRCAGGRIALGVFVGDDIEAMADGGERAEIGPHLALA